MLGEAIRFGGEVWWSCAILVTRVEGPTWSAPTEARVVALDSSWLGVSSYNSFADFGLAGGGSRRHLPCVVRYNLSRSAFMIRMLVLEAERVTPMSLISLLGSVSRYEPSGPKQQKQEKKYEVKPQYEELSKQINMQHAIKRGSLNFHSGQLDYLVLLQMGNADPNNKSKKRNKYEVKPQYEELSKQINMQHAINQCYECMRAIKKSDS
ncbi:hypothetical protein F511_10237 [Dorcoceras hygrometricum]|uniref:Uncharacterized protein n=1 Tax=Dorcoceras hygrometricum TaxID=472368 RepID=A0A2Z7D1B6_9LAMI|nr:hypothetical protein F511_10237 [Dorcoceras hygrometricum]